MNVKSLIFALVILISAGSLSAQNRGKQRNFDADKVANRQTEQMTKQLDLSDNQASEVAAINLEYAKKTEALRAEGLDREEMKQRIKVNRKEKQTAIEAVLTEEQIEKLDALKAEKKAKRKTQMQKRKADSNQLRTSPRKQRTPEDSAKLRTERLDKTVDLSDEQAQEVEAIILEYAQKKETMRAGKSSVDDMKALYQEEKDAIDAVLTPEQREARDAKMQEVKARKQRMRSGGR